MGESARGCESAWISRAAAAHWAVLNADPRPGPARPAQERRYEGSFRHLLAAWVAIMALIDGQVCLGHPEGQECQGSL